jgi:hypothetical protein
MEIKRTRAELLFDGDITAWNTLYNEHYRRFHEMFKGLPFTKDQAKDLMHEAIEKIRCEAKPHPRSNMYVYDVRREISILIYIALDKIRITNRNEKRMNRYYRKLNRLNKIITLSIPSPLHVRKRFNWDRKLKARVMYMKDELNLNYYQISRALKMKEQEIKDIYSSSKSSSWIKHTS